MQEPARKKPASSPETLKRLMEEHLVAAETAETEIDELIEDASEDASKRRRRLLRQCPSTEHAEESRLSSACRLPQLSNPPLTLYGEWAPPTAGACLNDT